MTCRLWTHVVGNTFIAYYLNAHSSGIQHTSRLIRIVISCHVHIHSIYLSLFTRIHCRKERVCHFVRAHILTHTSFLYFAIL